MLNNENTPMEMKSILIRDIEKRKLYVKPRLEEMGDLRTLTLGSSPGGMESGGIGGFHEPMETGQWSLPPY